MTIQMGTTLRTARSAAIETTIGTAPKVQIRTGAQPATPATADSGTLLVEFTLASDWASQTGGVLTFSGTPIAGTASGTGTAGHYRIKDNAGTTTHMQGSVTATGGGGDLTVDNAAIVLAQSVQITGWTITEGNV